MFYLFITIIFRLSIGSKITTYKTDQIEYYVFHLDEDKANPSNLLISDGCSIKSIGPKGNELITGKATVLGYQEGALKLARYGYITSFYQLPNSPQELVIVDYENHCLRYIQRKGNNFSRPFVGQCQIAGFSDDKGKEQFSHPYALIAKRNDPNTVIITDWGNSAIREVNVKSATSKTLIQSSNLNGPRGLAQDPKTGDLFVTTDFDVYRFSMSSKSLLLLAGTTKTGFKDGDFSGTMFHYIRGIAQLNEWQLAVTDGFNFRVRVLDMLTNTTTSICTGVKGTKDSADLKKCTMDDPQDVAVIDGKLMIAEHKNIRVVEGMCHSVISSPQRVLPQKVLFLVVKFFVLTFQKLHTA